MKVCEHRATPSLRRLASFSLRCCLEQDGRTGGRGGGLDPGPDQDREEQTGALLPEQEEVRRRRLQGAGGGRSLESPDLLPVRGR